MTRVVRNAALLCAAGILVASAALANVPDPAHSTLTGNGGPGLLIVEGAINVNGTGGSDNLLDLRNGDVTVTVRDFANNLIPGSTCVIDFTNCSDINLSCDQGVGGTYTGQTYVASRKVQGTTSNVADATFGTFTFKVQGAGPVNMATCIASPEKTCPGTLAAAAGCATVYCDGVPIGNLRIAAYDIDRAGSGFGAGAVTATDLSKTIGEVLQIGLGGLARARQDYEPNGFNTAGDVSRKITQGTDAGLGNGTRNTMHTGWATLAPPGGSGAGFCP
jgi:hypothetical protein